MQLVSRSRWIHFWDASLGVGLTGFRYLWGRKLRIEMPPAKMFHIFFCQRSCVLRKSWMPWMSNMTNQAYFALGRFIERKATMQTFGAETFGGLYG